MNTLNTYSSSGGELYPTIDKRAFSFSNDQAVGITIAEQRLESYNPTVAPANVSTLNNQSYRYEFNINQSSDGSMLDLANSFFEVSFQLNAGGFGGNIGLAPFAADSMITDCFIYLNTTLVSEPHTNLYPWSALAKNLLLQKRPACPTALAGWVSTSEDVVEEGMYTPNPLVSAITSAANAPYNWSFNYLTQSQTFKLKVRLKEGAFLQKNFLPAEQNLRIVLILQPYNAFIDLAAEVLTTHPVAVTGVTYNLMRVILTEDARRGLMGGVSVSPLKYPMIYSKIETKSIPVGSTQFNSHVFQSQTRPNMLMIFLQNTGLTSAAPLVICGSGKSLGAAATAPAVSQLFVRVNGKQYPAPTGPQMSNTNLTSYRKYVDMCLGDSQDVFLDYISWSNHWTAYCINLDNDVMQPPWGQMASSEMVSIDVYCTFPQALAAAATMYVVAITNASFTIDQGGNVTKFNFVN